MKTVINLYFRLLEAAMVLCLAAMCVMVFGNVLLRYAFDSGISSSEELSGFLFIWLTFLGAIVALREDGHLGVHMLVRRLTGASLLTVNVLAPGRIATARTQSIDAAAAKKSGKSEQDIASESAATIPAGRYGTVEEFGAVAAFLAGTGASYVTGSIIRVDGGAIRSI